MIPPPARPLTRAEKSAKLRCNAIRSTGGHPHGCPPILLQGKGTIVNIGDGLVDANAYPSTDAYIGYCGVTHKEKALREAMMVVDSFEDLCEIVRNILYVCFFTWCHKY